MDHPRQLLWQPADVPVFDPVAPSFCVSDVRTEVGNRAVRYSGSPTDRTANKKVDRSAVEEKQADDPTRSPHRPSLIFALRGLVNCVTQVESSNLTLGLAD